MNRGPDWYVCLDLNAPHPMAHSYTPTSSGYFVSTPVSPWPAIHASAPSRVVNTAAGNSPPPLNTHTLFTTMPSADKLRWYRDGRDDAKNPNAAAIGCGDLLGLA